MMRILTGIDLPFIPNCGSMILVNDLYSNLPKGVEVRFLALESPIPKDWSTIKDVKLLATQKITETNLYKQYVSSLSEEIGKHVKEFRPDIIHIQHLGFGMALAFSALQHPKIAVCHGTDIQYSLDNEFHKNNMIDIYNRSSRVIFPTQKVLDEFVRLTKIKAGGELVPWGIPDSAFNVNYKINNIRVKRLLYAGRLDSNKDVNTIIDSLKYFNSNISLTIIGSGDQRTILEDKVIGLNLQDRVTFKEFEPREKLWEEFSNFDAIVVSTKKIEAFCLVAIEAQAHGLPVIYAKTNGLIEVIGDSGLSFDPGNPANLAKKINLIMRNTSLRKDFSIKGIKNAKKYSITKTRDRFINLSEQVLGKSIKEIDKVGNLQKLSIR